MEYSIKDLSEIAGITTRTLRYYDEIDILKPAKISDSGYRIYSDNEVDLLQQILFYKELGLDLKTIKDILSSPSFDILEALYNHKENLLKKRQMIDLLINNVEKTIKSKERGYKMENKDKFEGFKKSIILMFNGGTLDNHIVTFDGNTVKYDKGNTRANLIYLLNLQDQTPQTINITNNKISGYNGGWKNQGQAEHIIKIENN